MRLSWRGVVGDPRVRRYAGVALIAGAAAGVAIGQAITSGPPVPVVRCAAGRAGAVAITAAQPLQVDQDNAVRVAIASCEASGVADLALLVSAPPGRGTQAAFTSDLDIGHVGGCERDHDAGGHVLLLCGPLRGTETRTVTFSVVPRRQDGSSARLSVTAIDVAGGAFDAPRTLDAAVTDLTVVQTSGGLPSWSPWVTVVIALVAGADMARRSRSGLWWTVGLMVFNVVGWLVWVRDRALWRVVPAGSPPVAAPVPRWVRRYSVGIGLAVPVGIVAFLVAGVALASFSRGSSGTQPMVVATPAPRAHGSTAVPTPCAGGALPPVIASATQIVTACTAAQVEPVVLHPGDTLGVVLPNGAVGAGSAVQVDARNGDAAVVDTGLGTSSAALLLARHPGVVFVQVVSVCPPVSGQCGGTPGATLTLRVDVESL